MSAVYRQQQLLADLSAYSELQANLKLMVTHELTSLKTKVNIGSDVYVDAIM